MEGRQEMKLPGSAKSKSRHDAVRPVVEQWDREDLLDALREANQRLTIASIREQELAEQAERQAAQWNAVVENMNDGVVVTGAAGEVVLVNPIGRAILGLPQVQELSPTFRLVALDLRRPDDGRLGDGESPFERARRGERFSDCEFVLVASDGVRSRLAFSGSTVRDHTGAVILAIVVFRDVTELRRLERIKAEYVSLVTHDLRTPLTIILGQADLLHRHIQDWGLGTVAPNIESLRTSARRMNALIRDLANTWGAKAGGFELQPKPTVLAALAREVVVAVASPEEQARIRIEEAGALRAVTTDAERIKRVMANLLSNALKYSPPDAPVVVRIDQIGDEQIVSVTDQGPGISADDVPRLFEKFFRTEASKSVEGQGLGLYIARQIVEASGGRIWVETEPGRGCTFRFSLPIG
jgi:PAS domain S-box-containing protein